MPLAKLTPYSAPPASALLSSKNWQRNVICGSFPSMIPVWKKLLATTKEYRKYIIPANTYSGQNKDVTTIGVKAVLLASDDLSKRNRGKTYRNPVFPTHRIWPMPHLLDAAFDETDASSGVTIPFHPGAAAYYAKQGISVNTK